MFLERCQLCGDQYPETEINVQVCLDCREDLQFVRQVKTQRDLEKWTQDVRQHNREVALR
jgi:hypothetical protein